MCRQLTLVTFVILANKRVWGNQYRKIQLQSKNAAEAERKARYRSLASFGYRSTAVEPAVSDGGGPDSGPGPAASRRFPPQGSAAGAVTTAGSLPNAPPRAVSPVYIQKSLSRGVHAENRRADCPCERGVTCAYQGAMTSLLTSRRVRLAERSPPRVPET